MSALKPHPLLVEDTPTGCARIPINGSRLVHAADRLTHRSRHHRGAYAVASSWRRDCNSNC